MIDEDTSERIAIIMEGCKVTESQAVEIMNRKDFSEEVNKLRQLATLQRMGKRRFVDGKTLALGE